MESTQEFYFPCLPPLEYTEGHASKNKKCGKECSRNRKRQRGVFTTCQHHPNGSRNPENLILILRKKCDILEKMWIEVIEYVIRIMDRYVQNYASEKRDKLIQGGKTTFSRKEI